MLVVREWVVLAIGIGALISPRPALAQASQPASQPAEQARRLFAEAETQYRLGNFETALRGYQEALKLKSHPSIVFNIAQCYRQLKNAERALFFYRLFLAEWERVHQGTVAPNEAEVRGRIEQLEAILRATEERRAKTLEAALKAAEARRAKALETARLAARKRRASANEAHVRLQGQGLAQARVFVDGLPQLVGLGGGVVVKPGRRHLKVEAPGYLPWEHVVNARSGREVVLPVELRPVVRRSRLLLGGTIASALLAAGAETLAIIYFKKADEHFRDSPPYDEDHRIVVVGHVVAGGMLAIAATSLFFYLRSGRSEPPPEVGAAVLPLSGGAIGQATFGF